MAFIHGLAVVLIVGAIIYTIWKEQIDNMIENLKEMMENG